MSDSFRNVDVGNLGEIGEDTKNKLQSQYDKADKKFKTAKDLEGGIGTLKAMVSGKKLTEALGDRLKPIIKRKVGEEYRAFKNAWQKKAQNGIERVLKPKATTEATEATESEGSLAPNLGDPLTSLKNTLDAGIEKSAEVGRRINGLSGKVRGAMANAKEAQASRIEAETEKTEQIARDAGFKNATTDKDIPAAVRQQTQAKYDKMGKLRQEAKDLRNEDQAEATESQEATLNDARPVSSQSNSQVENPNPDSAAETDANALSKASVKSSEEAGTPDNTPSPGKSKAAEEEEGAEEGGEEGGEEAGTTILEGIGGALDDTGILAPLGLLFGAIGIGLGADKKKEPVEQTNMTPEKSYSYQVGIN